MPFSTGERRHDALMRDLKPETFEDIAGILLVRTGVRFRVRRGASRPVRSNTIRLCDNLGNGVSGYQSRSCAPCGGCRFLWDRRTMCAARWGRKTEPFRVCELFIEGGVDEKGAEVPGALANGVPQSRRCSRISEPSQVTPNRRTLHRMSPRYMAVQYYVQSSSWRRS